MSDIKLLLKEMRQERDLSQEELAKALGVSRQSIISLEQGQYLPSSPLLLELIRFFDCALPDIISGVEFNHLQQEKGGDKEMQIVRWDPFQAIDQMHDEMSGLVEKSFGRIDWPRTLGTTIGAMNIHENDKEYEIGVQVPGYKEDEINVELGDDMLTVSGAKKVEQKAKEGKSVVRREWEHSEFSRSIHFATPIKSEKTDAKLEDGTLTIIAPKVEPNKPKTTKITVKKK